MRVPPQNIRVNRVHSLLTLRGILLKPWRRRIHLIPGMRVGRPYIHLQIEPARIIQARSSNRDDVRIEVVPGQNRRATVAAKASMGFATGITRGVVEAQCALRKLKTFRWHDDERGEWTSTGSLAIPTMTMKH
jgi:hypothetical protein